MNVASRDAAIPSPPDSEAALEELLSRPSPGVCEALRQAPGDVVVLGAGGKMGPSLTAMVRRACDATGDRRRVIAVSRWSDAAQGERLAAMGVEVVRSELTERAALDALPDAPNVIFMAGQKFGTSDAPAVTWMTNTVIPALVAERYRLARIVAFSTGNVYPLVPVASGGSREGDALAPIGDYAASCVGRERVLEFASRERGTRLSIIRLNYAVDLRYGVVVDLARRVLDGAAIDLRMGYFNCIWQGDANAFALRALPLTAAPPFVLNVTGPECLSVREVATWIGAAVGRAPVFEGTEAPDALLSDTTRAQSLFGAPTLPAATLAEWAPRWLQRGGRTLGKATRFEERSGRF